MALTELTQQGILEAGIAANMAANPNMLPLAGVPSEVSSDAKVFAFDNSELGGTHGRSDDESENVAGIVTASTNWRDRVANEIKIAEQNKDDATDIAMGVASATIANNLEKIRIGRITATRAELIAFSDAMKTPEFRAAFRQQLIDDGEPVSEVDERLDAAERLANVAPRIEDGTATAAERSQYEIDVADPRNVETLERGVEFVESGRVVRNTYDTDRDTNSMPVSLSDEEDIMAMMDAGASGGVTNVVDRQGPVISNNFEMAANGVSEPAPLTNVSESTPTVPQNNAISFG